MKSVGMTEPKQMATFIALGGIATALWFERESFSSWMELEDAFKKTWCTKLNPSDAIARACQTHQKEDGYIREYIVKFGELKRFFGEMSVPTLIDMFMRNTCCAVHDRYKELKQQDLTWEQFLTEVTVMMMRRLGGIPQSVRRMTRVGTSHLLVIMTESVSKPARKSHVVLFPIVLKSFKRN